ncbi:C-type lectin domain family 12 member B isoform X2 [Nycticebus coucang]|uniref:C-type lectin domain family 12 member B isoform X2 n=1 Tax=Nycticebus coucang TaxID=9470 RepID=UPI00234DDB23|nr:C-type lectin domain family 12 member B isoform X2 [Nycticebus coucang]
MSEDVTYTTLTLQDSAGTKNNQDGNNLRKKGHPAGSPIWRHAALSLLTLSLMLLIGLVTLGIMFLQLSNEINSESEKLSQLQKIVHRQQDNFSQQLDNYNNFPLEEEFLRSQISSLLKRQGQMAIKLCQELISHISDHRCNPCPKTWQWYQNSCYYFTTSEEKTWTSSRKDCTEKNSTLVKIDSLEEKDFLKSQPLPMFSLFWLGLSWHHSGKSWLWEDGSVPSPSFAEISWICEKTAALVKIEDLE